MRKHIILCITIMLAMVFAAGCGSNKSETGQDSNGKWTERYVSKNDIYTGESVEAVRTELSVDVYCDMSEEEYLDIIEQYKSCHNTASQDENYSCYAVFYKGDTDETVAKIKYCNNEVADITKEDEILFPAPELHNEGYIGGQNDNN